MKEVDKRRIKQMSKKVFKEKGKELIKAGHAPDNYELKPSESFGAYKNQALAESNQKLISHAVNRLVDFNDLIGDKLGIEDIKISRYLNKSNGEIIVKVNYSKGE